MSLVEMKPSDFQIGDEFTFNENFEAVIIFNRVTDVGTRTVTYIRLDRPHDPSWYSGPPYGVAEHVADEEDLMVIAQHRRPTVEKK